MTVPTAPGTHMAREIAEQPLRWADLLTDAGDALTAAARLIRDTDPELLVLAARGSSDHAAMYAQYLSQNLIGIPAMLSTPSTVTAFGTQLRYPRSVLLAISQSGSSPDLVDSVRAAGRAGVPVIAFTNNSDSDLAQLADVHVPLSAGRELSVAATKTYTAELLTLYVVLSLASGVDDAIVSERCAVATSIAGHLAAAPSLPVIRVAERLIDASRILVVGRGYSMSTAKEAALKLMETNAIAASGWSAADATHGPLGQVVPGTPVLTLTASPNGRGSVELFAAAAGGLGGVITSVGPPIAAAQHHLSWRGHDHHDLDPALLPALEIIPLQQVALELARHRGLDPDRPAGLDKVTRTV